MRIVALASLAIFAALSLQTACVKAPPPVPVFRMGENIQVGALIYNVFEAHWRVQMGEGVQPRAPDHRFLIVHLSVTNGGAEAAAVPALKLIDENRHVYGETMNGRNIPSWWGLIRNLKPAETREGNVVFDVEPKSYKLELDDDTDLSHAARVEMPLRFGLEYPMIPESLDISSR